MNNWNDPENLAELRHGRRETEPQAAEITFLYKVLHAYFPESRTITDLRHFYPYKNTIITDMFDVAFFWNLQIPYPLEEYHAQRFGNKKPTMILNIPSARTWKRDFDARKEMCQKIGISVYILFIAYPFKDMPYIPPYLEVNFLPKKDRVNSSSSSSSTSKTFEKIVLQEVFADEEKDYSPEDYQITTRPYRRQMIDAKGILPFNFALTKRAVIFDGDRPLFRLHLIDPDSREILLPPYYSPRRM